MAVNHWRYLIAHTLVDKGKLSLLPLYLHYKAILMALSTLTVRDLANRIHRRDEDPSAVIERIRHWTREGLLIPRGEKNPGTGRHRKYPETALEFALILNELADLGIHVGAARKFIFPNATTMRAGLQKAFDAARSGSEIVYLIFPRFEHDRPQPPYTLRGDHELGRLATEATVVLNLTKLFKRLRL
jgi:hypothetical protein